MPTQTSTITGVVQAIVISSNWDSVGRFLLFSPGLLGVRRRGRFELGVGLNMIAGGVQMA
jgi:hypothetical protein